MRIGILGGTFDPVHLGHLRTAEEAGEKLNLEKVYLIPSFLPPHKTDEPIAPFHHRLAMVRMAVDGSPLLDALDLEGRRKGVSYSIETLKELNRVLHPDPELFFILGTDAFLEIETWKDYRELFDYAHFVIIQRPGYEAKQLGPFLAEIRPDITKSTEPDTYLTTSGKTIRILSLTFMGISSTKLRRMVAQGKSIRFLVSEPVRKYIATQGLYRNDAFNR